MKNRFLLLCFSALALCHKAHAGVLAHTTAYVSGAMGFVTSATGHSSTASLTEFALFFAPPDPFDP